MPEVQMWDAVCAPSANATDYTTRGLFDCVALALTGLSGAGVQGVYFGHLTSHQLINRIDDQGNAVAQLRAFFLTYQQGVRCKAAINYQPEYGDVSGHELPRSHSGYIADLLRDCKPAGVAIDVQLDRLRNINQQQGATVTLNVANFELHAVGTLAACNPLNELSHFPEYRPLTMPGLAEFRRNERQGHRGRSCVIL